MISKKSNETFNLVSTKTLPDVEEAISSVLNNSQDRKESCNAIYKLIIDSFNEHVSKHLKIKPITYSEFQDFLEIENFYGLLHDLTHEAHDRGIVKKFNIEDEIRTDKGKDTRTPEGYLSEEIVKIFEPETNFKNIRNYIDNEIDRVYHSSSNEFKTTEEFFHALKHKVLSDINNIKDQKQKNFMNKIFTSVFNRINFNRMKNDPKSFDNILNLREKILEYLESNMTQKLVKPTAFNQYENKRKFNDLENAEVSSAIRKWLKLLVVKLNKMNEDNIKKSSNRKFINYLKIKYL